MTRAAELRSVCLLRLSSLGDVTHVVPVVRRLQEASPATAITWIVGRFEHRLVGDLPGVELLPFDKRGGLPALRELRRRLAGRRFDALLHMQRSLRSNLVSTLVSARRRIGLDPARSAELHGLFVRERIASRSRQHMVEMLMSFLEPLGIAPGPPRWDLPVPDEASAFAQEQLPDGPPVLVISPCSSRPLRNWHAAGYAAVADHAVGRLGWRVVLCGGPSALERRVGDEILACVRVPIQDLIGRDTVKRFLAVLQRTAAILTPDSGPLHLANAMGVKVIGLHAATPSWLSGPYGDQRWCVDRYDEAARRFRGKPAEQLRWGTRLEHPGVMELITVEDVVARLEALAREPPPAQRA